MEVTLRRRNYAGCRLNFEKYLKDSETACPLVADAAPILTIPFRSGWRFRYGTSAVAHV